MAESLHPLAMDTLTEVSLVSRPGSPTPPTRATTNAAVGQVQLLSEYEEEFRRNGNRLEGGEALAGNDSALPLRLAALAELPAVGWFVVAGNE